MAVDDRVRARRVHEGNVVQPRHRQRHLLDAVVVPPRSRIRIRRMPKDANFRGGGHHAFLAVAVTQKCIDDSVAPHENWVMWRCKALRTGRERSYVLFPAFTSRSSPSPRPPSITSVRNLSSVRRSCFARSRLSAPRKLSAPPLLTGERPLAHRQGCVRRTWRLSDLVSALRHIPRLFLCVVQRTRVIPRYCRMLCMWKGSSDHVIFPAYKQVTEDNKEQSEDSQSASAVEWRSAAEPLKLELLAVRERADLSPATTDDEC
eukprot:scaffold652_cov260-Pinguiococcus_pyrenoidosus.AAC.11